MPGFEGPRPITFADRDSVQALYFRYGCGDSAHAFPSIYLWQKEMGLQLLTGGEAYTVLCALKGENAWFFPVGTEEAKAACIEGLLERGLKRLCYVTEADAEFLQRRFPGTFTMREAPEDSEYIYDCRQVIEMPGKAYGKIRNRCRQLEKTHAVAWESIGPETLRDAAAITRQWKRNTDTGEGIRDEWASARVWDAWEELGMRGVMLLVDGEPWAAAAGYSLGQGVLDCCLMKARENLPGVTDHLRIALARSLEGEFTRLNLEEDLGVEGLRQMKERLRPCAMNRMYSGDVK